MDARMRIGIRAPHAALVLMVCWLSAPALIRRRSTGFNPAATRFNPRSMRPAMATRSSSVRASIVSESIFSESR